MLIYITSICNSLCLRWWPESGRKLTRGWPSCTQLHWAFIGQHVVKVCGQNVCYKSAQDHGRTSRLFEAAGIHIVHVPYSWLWLLLPCHLALGYDVGVLAAVSFCSASCETRWLWLPATEAGSHNKGPYWRTLSAFISLASGGKCVHEGSCIRRSFGALDSRHF